MAAVVAVLSALYVSSASGLQHYVAEQLERLPSDYCVIQQSRVGSARAFSASVASAAEISDVPTVGVLRVPGERGAVTFSVDGRPLELRWLVVISASSDALLPPELATAGIGHRMETAADAEPASVLAAVISSTGSQGLGAGTTVTVDVQPNIAKADSHVELGLHIAATERTRLGSVKLAGAPAVLRRVDFNRWSLATTGTLLYLPDDSLVISLPPAIWDQWAERFDRAFVGMEGEDHGITPALYLPEVIHLVRLPRIARAEWDLRGLLADALARRRVLLRLADEDPSSIHVASPRVDLLGRMLAVSHLLGLVTLVIGIPLLFAAWFVGSALAELLTVGERRTVALLRLRGVPARRIHATMRLALTIGALFGSGLGVIAGSLGAAAMLWLLGRGAPPMSWIFQAGTTLGALAVIGVVPTLIGTARALRGLGATAPHAALSRERESEIDRYAPSRCALAAGAAASLLGGFKLAMWMIGAPGVASLLSESTPPTVAGALAGLDWAAAFFAVPLLLSGLQVWARRDAGSYIDLLARIARPFGGRLRSLLHPQGPFSWSRRVPVAIVCALVVVATVTPAVVGASLTDRARRALASSVGGDLQLEFAASDFGERSIRPIGQGNAELRARLVPLEVELRSRADVLDVAAIVEFVVPSVYVPNQFALLFDVVEDVSQYCRVVQGERQARGALPISDACDQLAGRAVLASRGLMRVRSLRPGGTLGIATASDTILPQRIDGAISLLPGQPARNADHRAGYSNAETEYLARADASEARLYAAAAGLERAGLGQALGLPTRLVLLLRTRAPVDAATAARVVMGLPVRPDAVRFPAGEEARWTQDMFASLALANIHALAVSALVLAGACLAAVGLANRINERRTWGLIMLRGIPMSYLRRVALALEVTPVAIGAIVGLTLGCIVAHGLSQAIWELAWMQRPEGDVPNGLALDSPGYATVIAVVLLLIVVGIRIARFPRHTGSLSEEIGR